MDRDEIIRISRLASFGGLTASDINVVIMCYCIEKGKPYYESSMLMMKLLSNEFILGEYFNIALNYYKSKFTVYELWSSPDSNPLNLQGQRKLLQIF